MSDDVILLLETAEESMQKAISHLESELVKIRAGKANPQMLDGITVDYYGTPTPLNQIGNVNVQDARTLTVMLPEPAGTGRSPRGRARRRRASRSGWPAASA